MRILVIEDEKRIAGFIQRGLKEEKFVVDVANTGEEGLFLAEINPYDLILLDIMLPDKDGILICKELRKNKINAPILMLTARNAVHDRISGLNSGADDYLSKPFAFAELVARIRAQKEIPLTHKEYTLLQYLMLHTNQVVSRTMISEHVWNETFNNFTNVIDVYIKYLRNKIDKGHKKKLLHTIRGSGYILKDPQ